MWRAQRHTTPIALRARAASPARRRVTLGCAGLVAVAVAAAGCGAHNRSGAGNTPVNGGTVTYALPANVIPNYIFPFDPPIDYTIVNLDNLQYFLYRPLYWFGDSGKPLINKALSLAYQPQYNGHVVTIRLKPNLKWSNGELVTAKDVVFWMNMMKAEAPAGNFGGYIKGNLPDDVTGIHAVSQYEMKMTINGKYSQQWFTDNQLSQITPMPHYWDRTAPNSASDCTDHISDCTAVFGYLNRVAANKATWVTSPLWKVVDGPWQLTGYSSQGVLTFSYNHEYSLPAGPHHITTFREIPFTTEQAEFNQLQAGGSQAIDVGYLPTVDAPVALPGKSVGQNPVPNYALQPVYTWGLSYMPINFNPANPQVAIFRQQYIRQALQFLVDQAAIIQGALHGYGKPSTGPVGDAPPTDYLSPQARRGDPYQFSAAEARNLLREHGWDLRKGQVTTCGSPGTGPTHCGDGVKRGAALSFTMMFSTGNAWVQSAVLQLKSNASLVGIEMTLHPGSFDQVVGKAQGDCGPKGTAGACQWELADWGEGWSYVPDYLPTGDELFGTDSAGNIGQYSNKYNDGLIKKTIQTSSGFLPAMYKWQNWLTNQVPVLLQPTAPAYLIESIDNLKIGPQSPTLALTPEDWYYVR
jgi:peptide/nickel transport system substrate-binding protein